MIFNSLEFLFLFLPIVVSGYYFFNRARLFFLSKAWLVLTSLVFYSFWGTKHFNVILVSIITNYVLGRVMFDHPKKGILGLGLIFNLGILGYFKYKGFILQNFNVLFDADFRIASAFIPIGISFYTFQQISFLVDSYQRKAKTCHLMDYLVYITFFPKLIAGPIVYFSEIVNQFNKSENKRVNYENMVKGVLLFTMGLFKKVIIADYLSSFVTKGFDQSIALSFLDAWATSLSYTFQLYFDFSGYTDMALGIGLMFNVILPNNFISPYKSLNIREFWTRWHITLGRFIRDYIYIPLGGSRKGLMRTVLNLYVVFLVFGIWHGAGWNFVFWGLLHGSAVVLHRVFLKTEIRMGKILSWFITFNFVNICWIFFRSSTLYDAKKILKGMFGFNGLDFSSELVFLDTSTFWLFSIILTLSIVAPFLQVLL